MKKKPPHLSLVSDNNKAERKPPINIVVYEDNANLREVSWNQMFLEKVRKQHSLKHCQAVLYINVARDRFRLVVCFYGFAVLLLPPIDPIDRISLYLKISGFLKRFAIGFDDAIGLLDREIESATARLERRKALAEAAQQKRKESK